MGKIIKAIKGIFELKVLPARDESARQDSFACNLNDNLKSKLFQLPQSTLYKKDKIKIAKVIYYDNLQIDCVFFSSEQEYEYWHPFIKTKLLSSPEQLNDLDYNLGYRFMIDARKIKDIAPCPYQLPPKWCNQIYKNGEGYMGGFIFELFFKDGNSKLYTTGGIVDFIKLPVHYSFNDIIDIKPHSQLNKDIDYLNAEKGLPFIWCVYK